ncbi:dual specificity protein phosphatase family protein [Chitinophaga filiformis]|uniref:Dual specificity protein phosphatase family protein n=1 Tax=Chitinophaga filiformis TaxID=104663 RepID=A0ABY4I093_CHIFI|nr:dual specificity protein phosphatase family protein [Chitinophaga filiformis]UPK69513.1 dual specificity protein phosphatase family protein [Chitinophaga filiformis]
MATRIYWLHKFENSSQLGIMSRPRGNEWLEEEILSAKRQGVKVIVSLLEKDEILELDLQRQPAICAKHEILYLHFPIPDRSIPSQDKQLHHFIRQVQERIALGESTVIHCRMGIGRSSIIAGYLMVQDGYKPDEVFSYIGKVRGLRVPDTDEQEDWLKRISLTLKKSSFRI